jgi:hypothetical protein
MYERFPPFERIMVPSSTTLQRTVSLDEWFPTFQRIMVPSSTTLQQSDKNSQLAPLGPYKHTTKPVTHPSKWPSTTFSLSVTYLPTYFHTYPALDVLHRLLDRWRHYDPSKRFKPLTQHSVISQRPESWIKYHLDLNYYLSYIRPEVVMAVNLLIMGKQ